VTKPNKPNGGSGGAKSARAAKPAKAPSGPSFRDRFRAWWHGHDLPRPAAARDGHAGREAPADAPVANHPAAKDPPAAPVDPTPPPADPTLRVAHIVWSPGFLWPGGAKLARELATPLGLDSSGTLIEIGSGLGGAARAVAKELGTYVSGYDLDAEVAAEAAIQAKVHNLDERVNIGRLDPKRPNLRPDFYGAALVRETLYRVEDKELLLREVLSALKKDRPFAIFDLFAGSEKPSPALAAWTALEPHPVHLSRIEALRGFLEARKVEVRVTEDDSELYCQLAQAAWAQIVGRLDRRTMTKDLVLPLVREVERWARRIAALQAGDLKVWRVVGIKHVPVT
jgi:SAM-dependent methyltransferase